MDLGQKLKATYFTVDEIGYFTKVLQNKSMCASGGIARIINQFEICPVSSPDFQLYIPKKIKESLERRMRDTRINQMILFQRYLRERKYE